MSVLSIKNIFEYVVLCALIALGYLYAGKLSLMLVVPPLYSSAVWLGSGLALAAIILKGYKYLPALFIGAFFTNLLHYDSPTVENYAVVSWISCGVCLQAAIGRALICKIVNIPTALEGLKECVHLVFWGGFIACITSALIANTILYLTGSITINALAINSFKWWVGDVLGVIILTPMLLLLLSPKTALISLKRKIIVSVTFCLLLSVVFYIFTMTKKYEEQVHYDGFNQTTAELANILEHELSATISVLTANERFISASEFVSNEEFKRFTSKFFPMHKGIYGLSWIPKVTHNERQDTVDYVRSVGYENFEIKRRTKLGKLSISEEKPVYFPLKYTEPYAFNKAAHGLDVYGEDPVVGDTRIRLLDYARDTGQAVATAMFPIVQAEQQNGFIIYYPVYAEDMTDATIAERREKLIGFCNGIFIFPHMMRELNQKAEHNMIDIILSDLGKDQTESTIMFDSRTTDFKASLEPIKVSDYQNRKLHIFDIAGRTWRLEFIEQKDATIFSDWLVWMVLVGGLFLSSLTTLFALVITARTDIVERLVKIKTQETEESRRFLEMITENNPDLIFVKDKELRVVQANKAFLETYPPEKRDSVIGNCSTTDYSIEDYAEFTAMDRKAFRDGYSEIIERITFPDGNVRTLYTQKIRFYNIDGEQYILGIARDVTEREKLIDELSQTNNELEEFAYRTSHDLRAPLISSIKLLDMASSALNEDKKDTVEKCLDHSSTSLKKLEQLIDDILSLTQTKHHEEEESNISIDAMISESIDKLSYMDGFEDINIKIKNNVHTAVKCKHMRVQLIVENMISNAIKYQDDAEEHKKITIRSELKEQNLLFSVEDNGLGIPADQKDNLFAMFKRFHPKVSFGSGLGLYMMRKSANILGGDITFEDAEPKGAIFKLSIPIKH